jgi:hypothetical protein
MIFRFERIGFLQEKSYFPLEMINAQGEEPNLLPIPSRKMIQDPRKDIAGCHEQKVHYQLWPPN